MTKIRDFEIKGIILENFKVSINFTLCDHVINSYDHSVLYWVLILLGATVHSDHWLLENLNELTVSRQKA